MKVKVRRNIRGFRTKDERCMSVDYAGRYAQHDCAFRHVRYNEYVSRNIRLPL